MSETLPASHASLELPHWRLAAQIGPLPGEQADINKLGSLPGRLKKRPESLGEFHLLGLGKHTSVILTFESRIQNHDQALWSGVIVLRRNINELGTPAHLLKLRMGDYEDFYETPSDKLLDELPNALGELKTLEAAVADASYSSLALWEELLSVPESFNMWPGSSADK